MSEEFEELEHIPWAALATRTPDPRWRLALIAAAGCAAVVLLLVAGKVMLSDDAGNGEFPVDVPAGTGQHLAAATVPAATPERAGPTLSPAPETESLSPPTTYSEADLMAIALDEEERLAAMWAEWFVRDYLTIDSDGSVAAELADLLTIDLPAGEATTFVEWVDAFAVSTPAPAVYRIDVAYRLLAGADEGFVRRPPAALAVELAVDADGSVRLLQLPEVVSLPERTAVPVPALTEDLPVAVAEALDRRSPGVSMLGGYEQDSQWHVVVVGEIVPGVERPHLVVVAQE